MVISRKISLRLTQLPGSALAEPQTEEEMVQERMEYERTHNTAVPKWRLGMTRLAPPVNCVILSLIFVSARISGDSSAGRHEQVPTKYNPDAYSVEGVGSRLDQQISMKTTKLKQASHV